MERRGEDGQSNTKDAYVGGVARMNFINILLLLTCPPHPSPVGTQPAPQAD